MTTSASFLYGLLAIPARNFWFCSFFCCWFCSFSCSCRSRITDYDSGSVHTRQFFSLEVREISVFWVLRKLLPGHIWAQLRKLQLKVMNAFMIILAVRFMRWQLQKVFIMRQLWQETWLGSGLAISYKLLYSLILSSSYFSNFQYFSDKLQTRQ